MSEPDEKNKEIDPATKEAWDYLMEVLSDYEGFLSKIGDLGFSAPQLLYYRDEVQEFLEELTDNPEVNYQGAYKKTLELDKVLKERAQDLVDEIGHENFLQYQVINDPPKKHWWWWINRITKAPPPEPKVWQFWKYQSTEIKEEISKVPPKDSEIGQMFYNEDGELKNLDSES